MSCGGQIGGQLSIEGRIVGRLREGVAKKLFGFRILLSGDEQMREPGGGRLGLWVIGKQAAVSGFGGVELTR